MAFFEISGPNIRRYLTVQTLFPNYEFIVDLGGRSQTHRHLRGELAIWGSWLGATAGPRPIVTAIRKSSPIPCCRLIRGLPPTPRMPS